MDKLGKIRGLHWKARFEINESDVLKTNKDTAPQTGEILQTFVWLGA